MEEEKTEKVEEQKTEEVQPVKKSGNGKKILFVIIAVVVVFIIIGASGNKGTKTLNTTEQSTNEITGTSADNEVTQAPVNNKTNVTMAQFSAIKEGMTYDEVISILGSEGEVLSSSEVAGIKTVMYKWDGNTMGANMNAMFQNGKMISKAQFGLE